ncbi:MAG: sulfite exporter TauE/SafE family protein [Ilumatobacter sp.]|nr:sulfite exporter TauE/SafE family protein [Ilumatobacter sp.]
MPPDSSHPTDLRVAAAIGLAAGVLGGLFGVGGGLIIVPGLVLVAKLDRRLASGTSLAATMPIALASVITYAVNGNIDAAVVALLTVGAVGGAVLGTKLLMVLPVRTLTIVFIVTVLATAVRLFQTTETTGRSEITLAMAGALILVGVLTGTLSGLLGIGGGIVMVPAMIVLFGMEPVIAKGSSVTVIVPTSVTGTVRNRYRANVDLRVAAVVGLSGAASAVAGGIVADGLSSSISNVMFAVLLVLVAASQFATLRTGRVRVASSETTA